MSQNYQYYQQQPPKPGMSAGKVVLIVFVVIGVVIFGTCAACAGLVGSAANDVAEKEEKALAKAATCDSTQVVTWASLSKDLKENEAAVVARWKGKCAKVSGIVEGVDSGFDDKPFVKVGSGERFSFSTLHCHPKDAARALKLKKGDSITVWGLGGDEMVGSLMMDGCDW